jgi:hypothetical protein
MTPNCKVKKTLGKIIYPSIYQGYAISRFYVNSFSIFHKISFFCEFLLLVSQTFVINNVIY